MYPVFGRVYPVHFLGHCTQHLYPVFSLIFLNSL
nr:MAG TPA: hypothetical protein [Caudoviricetes sp.]